MQHIYSLPPPSAINPTLGYFFFNLPRDRNLIFISYCTSMKLYRNNILLVLEKEAADICLKKAPE